MKKTSIKMISLVSILLMISVLLAACKTETITEQTTVDPVSSAYPGSVATEIVTGDLYEEGYPVDNENSAYSATYPQSIEIPSPEANTGVVIGKLIDASNQEPYLAPSLYLGSYLQAEVVNDDMPRAISISSDTDPKAVQALDGAFVFSNIEPGEYGLFIWSPMSFFLVKDPGSQSGENIIVIVQAGEITDLGVIPIE